MTIDPDLLEPVDRRLRIQALPREELAALLQAVREHPEEGMPRAVLADWLEEHGDARAQVMRWSLLPADADSLAQHTLAMRLKQWSEAIGPSWWGELPRDVELVPVRGLWRLEGLGAGVLWNPELRDVGERLTAMLDEGWVESVTLSRWNALGEWVWEFLARLPVVRLVDFRDGDLARVNVLEGVQELSLDHGQGYFENYDPPFSGAGLAHLSALPHLQKLQLLNPQDVTELPVGSLRGLRELRLEGARALPAQALASLAGLANLEVLALQGCPDLTDSGLAPLASLPRLRVLDLSDCYLLMDEALDDLARCSSLRELLLESCTGLSGEALNRLSALEGLEVLDLRHGPRVTDDNLAALAGLRHLRTLRLNGAQVSDNGLAHLARLPALETLSLAHSNLSESSANSFDRMPALRDLDLQGAPLPGSFLTGLSGHRRLERLNLTWCGDLQQARLANLPSLTHLDLAMCRGLEHVALAGLSALRSCRLSGCERLQRVRLEGLERLVSLRLDGCEALTHLEVADDLPELEALELGGCARLDPSALALLGRCPRLRTLDLRGCPWLTDEHLRQVLPLRCLRSLMFKGCARLSDAGVAHLAEMPGLRALNLRNVQGLTEACLPALARMGSLRQLLLPERRFSRSTLRQLRSMLPDCHIEPR